MTDINDRKAKLKEIVETLKPATETAIAALRELSDNLEEDELETDETDDGDGTPYWELRTAVDEQVDELESALENLEGLYEAQS